MSTLFAIHGFLGERLLPLLIVLAAIWLVVRWRPDPQPDLVARLFPVLVDIQVALGIIYFVYGLVTGAGARYLTFPFILHPILGILAAGVAHMAVRPRGFAAGMGRWAPLVPLALLLVLVIGNVVLARAA